jgi:hypothetical protein
MDSNPSALAGLYQPTSMLSFEGQEMQGGDAILAKYATMGALQHNIPEFTMDVQMGSQETSLLIMIVGRLTIDGGNPLLFTQFFHLVATGPGQYYVHNEIFRLVY